MYDTVFLCLTQADVSGGGVDFLKVVPRFWWGVGLLVGVCRLPAGVVGCPAGAM